MSLALTTPYENSYFRRSIRAFLYYTPPKASGAGETDLLQVEV
jgi:hypothetical protein